jgi:hypothetical protein
MIVGTISVVAQISNLLCHRASSLQGINTPSASESPQFADWKSAIQQIRNLRYTR